MGKTYAVVVGLVLTVVGIFGFVHPAEMMGMQFNTIHNVIHLATGLIGLAAGLGGGEKGGKGFAKVFGLVYTLVAILGFANVAYVVNMLNLNMTYNIIHLAVGLLGLLAGFMGGGGDSN
ncbi:MAG: DUF4383 domain-containing protein [Candidatus Acidiferrales bacterium]